MYSMEAAADEERRMVLDLLEKAANQKENQKLQKRPQSPATSTRSPARSMLSVASSSSPVASRPAPRSMLDVDTTILAPASRSMLGVDSPLPRHHPKSLLDQEPKSPQSPQSPSESEHRSILDPSAAESSTSLKPLTAQSTTDSARPSFDQGSQPCSRPSSSADPTSAYRFSDIYTSNMGAAMPKRNTLGGKIPTGLLAEGLSKEAQSPAPVLPEQSMRHASAHSTVAMRRKSKSPLGRLTSRSVSPGINDLSTSASKSSPAALLTLDSGRQVVTDKAYTILSDANLATHGIMLGSKGQRDEEEGLGPMGKTYMSPDGDVILTDSSDADEEGSSGEDTRGRQKTRRKSGSPAEERALSGRSLDPERHQQPQSLLAAAEEERINLSVKQQESRRSLLEPSITITSPHGDRSKPPRGSVHPATAYDEGGASGLASPVDSDAEDIKRAQNLTFSQTGIISQPESHRTIRIIYRGEYSRIQQKAKEDDSRVRKYLVASDLSDESSHALEWAVGTVLRDGDTLIAICCIDEESGIASGDVALVPDDPKAMREQAAAIREVTSSGRIPLGATPAPSQRLTPSPRLEPIDNPSTSSVGPPPGTAAELERSKAVETITEKITRLLRRTRLQVRVIVEVLHCKNPKHLITEVIDLIEPTLVILGSRGRSALKGVILGSFSNYLVTKSSVPVMVARKKLRKTSKYKKAPMRQVNNLEDPTAKSLSLARID